MLFVMKIIQALKEVKDLQKKAEDLRLKVKQHSADLDYETPVYPDQKRQIDEWIQAHSDIMKQILKRRLQIQKTNLETNVTIELGDNKVTKPIAAWVHRRRDLAEQERTMWAGLTDKGLKENQYLPPTTAGGAAREVKLRRYYEPAIRDKNIEQYRTEPHVIDSTLEVVNAVTDLIED